MFRDLSVSPIFGAEYPDPGYSLLAESINSGGLTVEEVSESGVVGAQGDQRGDLNILLVDGEELSGAAGNRVSSIPPFSLLQVRLLMCL